MHNSADHKSYCNNWILTLEEYNYNTFQYFLVLSTKEIISSIIPLLRQNEKKTINFIDYNILSITKIITATTCLFCENKFVIDLSEYVIL